MNNQEIEYNYNKIDSLVFGYQNGDTESAEELITIFTPYLKKYLKIMQEGSIDLKDKDSRKFIALFIKSGDVRRKLLKAYQSTEVRHSAYKAAGMLHSMCKPLSVEDLMQELITLLLKVAKRYKKKGTKVNFCGYLYNTFRFEIYRSISSITVDPLVHASDFKLSYYDESYLNEKDMFEDDPLLYVDEPIMLLDEDLGNSWIRGLTCGEAFEQLTPIQRLILKLKYQDRISDVEISNRLDISRNTIRRQRNQAIEILKNYKGD